MVCFSPCYCCISTWFLYSVCSLGEYLPTTVLQIVKLRWEEQMINTNSTYWLMCCFQSLRNLFVFSYMCVSVMSHVILSHQKALHMKGVDLFRFILVKTGKIWMLSRSTSHCTLYFFTFTLSSGNTSLACAMKFQKTTSLRKSLHTLVI